MPRYQCVMKRVLPVARSARTGRIISFIQPVAIRLPAFDMIIIGLTGGIGMGKSTAGGILGRNRVPVCDTDVLARQVVEPGQPALKEIEEGFGSQVIGTDGQLRRDVLARVVFGDSERRRQLEAIVHPRIRRLWQTRIEAWRTEDKPYAVVVIPLLFEVNAVADFDAVLCVACSGPSQRRRLMARGWNDEEIDRRVAAQWPAQKKMDLADYVVWTEGGLDVHEAQLLRILDAGLSSA